ncbi:hypothetical protein CSQ89_03215 [Chitinimonas sp. BJB300]|nr:hypothetical protein CSQ89_03215 [Chitinimonas sp. BJB300]
MRMCFNQPVVTGGTMQISDAQSPSKVSQDKAETAEEVAFTSGKCAFRGCFQRHIAEAQQNLDRFLG